MSILIELGSLFVVAFLAATLVPLGSEAVLLSVVDYVLRLGLLVYDYCIVRFGLVLVRALVMLS